MIYTSRGDDHRGVAFFDRALEVDPRFVEARRYRGILRARLGRFSEAQQDVNWCFENERPTEGATLYAAACVACRAAERANGAEAVRATADQALMFLGQAFEKGYGRDKVLGDPDLAFLRGRPEFKQVIERSSAQPKEPLPSR
jgi:hypothetical protein